MTQEEKNGMVEKVLADFDFERVNKAMQMFDWLWAGHGDKLAIPEIEDIVAEAKQMLLEVMQDNKGFCCILRGGFAASWNGKTLKLDFILETSEYERLIDL